MQVIARRNINTVFPEAVRILLEYGHKTQTRNGPAWQLAEPMATVYLQPWERVLFNPVRDCNHFFHLFETLWMLAGRQDAAYLCRFNSRMAEYANWGIFHGAYGHRWRYEFGIDQIERIIENLRKNPGCRRQVLGIWHPPIDLLPADAANEIRDVPCNTQAMFQRNPATGDLDMMVCNRSNDIIWGAYGANVVHFSILHELIARGAGMKQGRYTQVSFNWHAYANLMDFEETLEAMNVDRYRTNGLKTVPLLQPDEDYRAFLSQCAAFVTDANIDDTWCRWFRMVAGPMRDVWRAVQETDHRPARWAEPLKELVPGIEADDWREGVEQWLKNRINRWNSKNGSLPSPSETLLG